MRQFLLHFRTGLRNTSGFVALLGLRALEKRAPLDVLYRGLWWFYLPRAFLNELFKRPRSRAAWPPALRFSQKFRVRVGRRVEKYLNDLLFLFTDRLVEPRWQERCAVVGAENLLKAQAGGRAVVLAFFHYGPFYLLRLWLRATGFPVAAFMGGHSKGRTRLRRYVDRLTPFREVPLVFYPNELRAAHDFLAAGNILCIAVDARADKTVSVPFLPGYDFEMPAGAMRFAIQHQAALLLVRLDPVGPWRYRLHLSAPFEVGDCQTPMAWQAAGEFLLAQMRSEFLAHPERIDLSTQAQPFKSVERN
jgi:hypothetical protein